jgi:cyclic pyranopterin phosphate synthase
MLQRTGRMVAKQVPAFAPALKAVAQSASRLRSSIESTWPALVRARTEKITIAITAHCNLRCMGCRYGRDFMPGSVLPTDLVYGVLEDAASAGIPAVRLYGGEPLLHPDLASMLSRARALGVGAYITTNGLLLGQQIEKLHDAGLRKTTIGYYGQGAAYDAYVQRPGRYKRLIESLETTRRLFGPDELKLQMNFLLSRQSCSDEMFDAVHRLAKRFDAAIQIDIVHYSLPYFQDGPELDLQFGSADADQVNRLVEKLVRLKDADPQILTESRESLASIADWAIKGPEMRVPCDAGKLLWIGADGSVKLCYAHYRKRASEIIAA